MQFTVVITIVFQYSSVCVRYKTESYGTVGILGPPWRSSRDRENKLELVLMDCLGAGTESMQEMYL